MFYVTAEILDYLTGAKLTGLNVLGKYVKSHVSTDREFDRMWSNLSDNGVNSKTVIQSFLCSSSTNNVVQSLLNGYPVAATINQPGGAHEVFITGFSFFGEGRKLDLIIHFLTHRQTNMKTYLRKAFILLMK